MASPTAAPDLDVKPATSERLGHDDRVTPIEARHRALRQQAVADVVSELPFDM